MPTLQSGELLLDVIRAFSVQCPAARMLGGQFVKDGLKYGKVYTPHIATLPTAQTVSTTYDVPTNDARNLLTDIPITINVRKGVRLSWDNAKAIEDDKFQYDKVIRSAGSELAKAFMLNLADEMTSVNFSKDVVFSTANSDSDMLDSVCETMNAVGAATTGRVMIVNSTVASTLNADARVASKEYQGRSQGGNAQRTWQNMNGFELIQEWPSLPALNSGAAIGGTATIESDERYLRIAHGLITGQKVELTSFVSGTGLTPLTQFYFHRVNDNEGKLCSSLANAIAGTPGTAATTQATSVVLTPKNNLTGFASDGTAILFMAGPEDHSEQMAMANNLGIPNIIAFDSLTDPDTGIGMSLVKFQSALTGDLNWMPVLIWGKRAGRAGGASGTLTDYGGCRVASA